MFLSDNDVKKGIKDGSIVIRPFNPKHLQPVSYDDRSFTFVMKNPPASKLILKALGLEKGSGKAKEEKVGVITKAQIATIVEEKMPDLNANSPEAAARLIAGTARSMGIDVK